MRGIRLSDDQIIKIRNAFKESFSEGGHLWLFGSRADLQKRGGDIELYVESTIKNPALINKSKSMFLAKLHIEIEEQKIDVIVKFEGINLLIYKMAKEQGVQLV